MLYLLFYVKGLKVKALISFMFLFLLAVVVCQRFTEVQNNVLSCIIVAVRYLFNSVENDQLRIFFSKRKKERGGEGMTLSPDNEKTTKSRPPFLRATYASLIRDRSTILAKCYNAQRFCARVKHKRTEN